jgi:hypothetical protein
MISIVRKNANLFRRRRANYIFSPYCLFTVRHYFSFPLLSFTLFGNGCVLFEKCTHLKKSLILRGSVLHYLWKEFRVSFTFGTNDNVAFAIKIKFFTKQCATFSFFKNISFIFIYNEMIISQKMIQDVTPIENIDKIVISYT